PGGFGTLDEVFEILTLSQTGKLERPIKVLLYGRDYWTQVVSFETLVRFGTIAPKDLELFCVVDSLEEALVALEAVFATAPSVTDLSFAKSVCVKQRR
ncbi:MAG: LOG family protein, partial [Myxococcales bacterium]|nr:LOG family protein [Myxococcales bacterium]